MFRAYCDGGAKKNPGLAAIGIVILDKNYNILEEYKECIGEATNNVAEYKALIKALELLTKYTRGEIDIYMDSELVINQVNRKYRIKEKHLLELFEEVRNKAKTFKKITYNLTERNNEFQKIADELVNEAYLKCDIDIWSKDGN